MPEEVPAASAWLLNKITGDLQGAKMWPVKLRSLKHQEALSSFEEANGFDLFSLFNSCAMPCSSPLRPIHPVATWFQPRCKHDSSCWRVGAIVLSIVDLCEGPFEGLNRTSYLGFIGWKAVSSYRWYFLGHPYKYSLAFIQWKTNKCVDSSGKDPSSVDMAAMEAANKLAKQRMDMYQEDCKVASSLTKTSKTAKARDIYVVYFSIISCCMYFFKLSHVGKTKTSKT